MRGKLEAGEAPGRESKINLLRLNKLILAVPGGGKAGGWGGTGQGIQNQFVEAQQIDFGVFRAVGRLEGGEAPGQGIQNEFAEAQQIDSGCSGPLEAGGWGASGQGIKSKINLLSGF